MSDKVKDVLASLTFMSIGAALILYGLRYAYVDLQVPAISGGGGVVLMGTWTLIPERFVLLNKAIWKVALFVFTVTALSLLAAYVHYTQRHPEVIPK